MTLDKKIISAVLFLLVLVGLLLFFYKKSSEKVVILGGKSFSVEIADTDALRAQGLSGHTPLSNNQGMLFIFPKEDKYGFWMKDMLFPIDIVWIDKNFQIIHIEKYLTPETYPKIFFPQLPSLYVLEVSAGQSDRLGLKLGDQAKFVIN